LLYLYYIIAERRKRCRNNWLGWVEHVEVITIKSSGVNTVDMQITMQVARNMDIDPFGRRTKK